MSLLPDKRQRRTPVKRSLTTNEAVVLASLQTGVWYTVSEANKAFNARKGHLLAVTSLTQVLNRLAENGYIEKKTEGVTKYKVTDSGKKKLEAQQKLLS